MSHPNDNHNSLSSTAAVKETSSTDLKAATYNIHSCVGSDGVYSVKRVAKVVADMQADIVCLQEVEVNSQRQQTRVWSHEHGDHQPQLLAKRAGYSHYQFAPAIRSVASGVVETFHEGNGEFGVALLSKYPIVEHRVIPFAPYKTKTPRNALLCKIRIPLNCEKDTNIPNPENNHDHDTSSNNNHDNNKSHLDIWVICTHLGMDVWGIEQHQQAQELRHIIEMELLAPPLRQAHLQTPISNIPHNLPVILCGDLNSPTWFRSLRVLTSILTNAPNSQGTFPSMGMAPGIMTLDYILYNHDADTKNDNNVTIQCRGTTVYTDGDACVASDHRPLGAILRIIYHAKRY